MEADELRLTVRALAGDREAAGELAERYRERALRWSLKVVQNATDAEEIVAEATVRMLERIHELRDPAALPGWLYRTVFRDSLNLLRARRTERKALAARGPREKEEGEPLDFTPEEIGRLKDAVKGLRPEYAAILTLHYWEGMPYGEIARRLGVPAGTVKARAFRAHEELRRVLRKAP